MSDLRSKLIAEIPSAGKGWCLSLTERKVLEFVATALALCVDALADRIEAARAREKSDG